MPAHDAKSERRTQTAVLARIRQNQLHRGMARAWVCGYTTCVEAQELTHEQLIPLDERLSPQLPLQPQDKIWQHLCCRSNKYYPGFGTLRAIALSDDRISTE